MSLFDRLWRSGALRTLDHALALSLRRLDPDTPDLVLAGAALASLAVAHGHAGFDPARPGALLDVDIEWPAADVWHQALQRSDWVATPISLLTPASEASPLVFENGLLYLRRYREYERRLAAGLQRIAAAAPRTVALAPLAPLFTALFPQARVEDDRQALAAAAALRHGLLLMTGGPGTGKTTTITRLLVLLVAQAAILGKPAPRIAMAAPTGRAAERMAASMHHARGNLQPALAGHADTAGWFDALPGSASTLHRLLGVIHDVPRFRHDADNPLAYDVVVVDEASMVDLPLMCKLLEAIADGTRLILLGDPDQLPSVEAGDVLSAILRAAGDGGAVDTTDAAALEPLLGGRVHIDAAAALGTGRRVHLQRGYRQDASFELAPLAEAVRRGDADTVLALLRDDSLQGVHFHAGGLDPLQHDTSRLLAHWRGLADASDPVEALARAGQLRLLAALREGPQGARGLNARIESLLGGRRPSAQRGSAMAGYFHGRLLLVTENSARHRLFNGDVGVCLRDPSGTVLAWFMGGGDARAFHPSTLPAHESAFAMTVHKSQGSEFDEVWLQLPAHDSRVLTRELLYTGLTRARRQVHLFASDDVLRTLLARKAERVTGLTARLT